MNNKLNITEVKLNGELYIECFFSYGNFTGQFGWDLDEGNFDYFMCDIKDLTEESNIREDIINYISENIKYCVEVKHNGELLK